MEQPSLDVKFATVPEAVQAIKDGKFVVVMDDEGRENEGDLIMAAEDITPAQMAQIVRFTTGIICAPMTKERAEELKLPRMVQRNEDANGTAFTVTCDHVNTTTGVSAIDRCTTMHGLANYNEKADKFNRPGHIFPLIARDGGVLERRGHTEAGVDLCKLAGKSPVAVIGELVKDDGEMMRLDDCYEFASKFGFPLVTVDALVEYRKLQRYYWGGSVLVKERDDKSIFTTTKKEPATSAVTPVVRNLNMMTMTCTPCNQSNPPSCKPRGLAFLGEYEGTEFVAETNLPTENGSIRFRAYRTTGSEGMLEPIVIVSDDIGKENSTEVPLRVHDQCVTSEVFGSMKCDCRLQLEMATQYVREHGGCVIYLQQEGRGIGLANKVAAYNLQEKGMDTVDANRALGFADDYRTYECVKDILSDLKVSSVKLLTNNPRKIDRLRSAGIDVVERLPIVAETSPHSSKYLQTKEQRMGHILS